MFGSFNILDFALCYSLEARLLEMTWPEFIGWNTLGLFIYFFYGTTHSTAVNALDNIKQNEMNHEHNSIASSSTKNGRSSNFESMALSRKKQHRHEHNDTNKTKEELNRNFKNQAPNGIIRNYLPS